MKEEKPLWRYPTPLLLGTRGFIDGLKIHIVAKKKWGREWVYKVKVGSSGKSYEYLTAKQIGNYQDQYVN